MTLRRAFRAALVVVPIGLLLNLAVTLGGTDRAVLGSLRALQPRYLVIATLLAFVPWMTGSLRLMIWVRLLGHRLSFRDSLRMNVASDVGGAVTPTGVGGGLFKWGLLLEHGVSPGAAATLAGLNTVEDLAFFIVSVPTAIALSSRTWRPPDLPVPGPAASRLLSPTAVWTWILVILLTWVGLRVLLGTSPGLRIRRVLRRAWRKTWVGLQRTARDARAVVVLIVTRGRLRFLASFTLAGIQWTARWSIPALLLAYLGAPVDPFLGFALQALVFFLTAIVPTPGATGGAEAAFLLMYGRFVPRGVLGLATAAWRFLTFYTLAGVGAVLFLVLSHGSARRRADALGGPLVERPSP